MVVKSSKMRFYGVEHTVDIFKIRCQMVALDGARPTQARGIDGWAERMAVSHMTLRRLFRGESIRLTSLLQVIESLDLPFADVCAPVDMAASAA